MPKPPPKTLIINSPYKCPSAHWKFFGQDEPPERISGRREAGYTVADPRAQPHQDRGIFIPLPLVNQIRKRVDGWREQGYPGITGITKSLLEHWKDNEQREFPFFFCQIEAIETLIWLIETPASEKVGIEIPGDGGAFRRLCSKLATGAGKTVVMAMLIAWQVLNRATYPRDRRFSKNVLIVAPNLTIRERLSVLKPSSSPNYYDEFGVVPTSLSEKLRQAKIVIRNWHGLQWETEEKIKERKSVDKRGVKSDEAYVREVLGDMADAKNIIVINDEAHHAWRVPVDLEIEANRQEKEEATKWIGGLDRIHKARGILNCFDFSATPFMPSSNIISEEALYGWIVSDFGLNDAIESGLVKTPRIVVRDDALPNAKTYKPRLYHIYPEVKEDLNHSAAQSHEPLPDLVRNAYALLGSDWQKTKEEWVGSTPPVMITVANRTETAARINHAFKNKDILVEALCEEDGILHIDSKVLRKAEEKELEQTAPTEGGEEKKDQTQTEKERADYLRRQVNTVGKEGEPGERKQNIISVGMLSEGWDARTVTHIMGLRAFTSQLLCEQVIGRGLRRASYEINEKTNLFDAEYVNVFGVPFSFLPQEGTGVAPSPSKEKITIRPVKKKKQFAISWPNVFRIDRTYKPELSVDWEKAGLFELDASETIELVEIAPTVDNQPDVSNISDIDLEELMQRLRRQTIIFKAAQSVWEEMRPNWQASKAVLMAELVRLAEQFIVSGRIRVIPDSFDKDEKRKQFVIALNISRVIRHFEHVIKFHNTEKLALVLDSNHPICSTGDMRPWRTGKPVKRANKSHINYCVCDSTWEAGAAFRLDRDDRVEAWVKNDHLGFHIFYVYRGVTRKYFPDFIIRLKSGLHLVLEVKGQQTDQDTAKQEYIDEWIEAVNTDGRFGQWAFAVSRNEAQDIADILAECEKQHTTNETTAL